jgi:23S rRNA G2445 N2-methylase RlmL
MNYFATAVPGLGKILEQEVAKRLEANAIKGNEFDGRNDIVSFSSARFEPQRLRISEDVYVEVGSAQGNSLEGILGSLLQPEAIEKGLSVFASQVKPLRARMSFRVIARVLSEQHFKRSELRDRMMDEIGRLRPRWETADPAELEFWILESRPLTFRLGMRLTGKEMRHRGGRIVERPGSLKPTVAAAMVFLAGEVGSRPLVDPACGTGTILSEAADVGWQTVGSDIDRVAAAASRENLARPSTLVADARTLPFPLEHFGALLSNLPFGKQYRVQGPEDEWIERVLEECCRITASNAPIVLLVPAHDALTKALQGQSLKVVSRWELRVKGEPTTLWDLRKVSED